MCVYQPNGRRTRRMPRPSASTRRGARRGEGENEESGVTRSGARRGEGENEESPGRKLSAETERSFRGSQADTSTIGRSAGVSLRLDLFTSPVSPPRKAAWRAMPLFGVPSRSPDSLSVATVHADPVSRVTDVVPIGRCPPRNQLGWLRFVDLPPVRSFLTVTRGSVPHRRCLCPALRLRCVLPVAGSGVRSSERSPL